MFALVLVCRGNHWIIYHAGSSLNRKTVSIFSARNISVRNVTLSSLHHLFDFSNSLLPMLLSLIVYFNKRLFTFDKVRRVAIWSSLRYRCQLLCPRNFPDLLSDLFSFVQLLLCFLFIFLSLGGHHLLLFLKELLHLFYLKFSLLLILIELVSLLAHKENGEANRGMEPGVWVMLSALLEKLLLALIWWVESLLLVLWGLEFAHFQKLLNIMINNSIIFGIFYN